MRMLSTPKSCRPRFSCVYVCCVCVRVFVFVWPGGKVVLSEHNGHTVTDIRCLR